MGRRVPIVAKQPRRMMVTPVGRQLYGRPWRAFASLCRSPTPLLTDSGKSSYTPKKRGGFSRLCRRNAHQTRIRMDPVCSEDELELRRLALLLNRNTSYGARSLLPAWINGQFKPQLSPLVKPLIRQPWKVYEIQPNPREPICTCPAVARIAEAFPALGLVPGVHFHLQELARKEGACVAIPKKNKLKAAGMSCAWQLPPSPEQVEEGKARLKKIESAQNEHAHKVAHSRKSRAKEKKNTKKRAAPSKSDEQPLAKKANRYESQWQDADSLLEDFFKVDDKVEFKQGGKFWGAFVEKVMENSLKLVGTEDDGSEWESIMNRRDMKKQQLNLVPEL